MADKEGGISIESDVFLVEWGGLDFGVFFSVGQKRRHLGSPLIASIYYFQTPNKKNKKKKIVSNCFAFYLNIQPHAGNLKEKIIFLFFFLNFLGIFKSCT
jgi:hypothetical protein